MSPKRKIPSRKLPSRKFATRSASVKNQSAEQTASSNSGSLPPRKSPLRPATKSNLNAKPKPKPKPGVSVANPEPPIPACYWDMGFESVPTLEELRQRYKELSLVLHPDAGGNKEAFLALRTNYETAQATLLADGRY